MRINLDNEPGESQDFVTIAAGTYLCNISEIRERKTKNGDDLWALRLIVAEGEFTGRHAAWDNLVFSERGLSRVRRVLEALDLPHKGQVDLDIADIVNKYAFVRIRPVEFTHPHSGQTIKRNEVHYDGYAPVPEGFVPPTMPQPNPESSMGQGSESELPPPDMDAIPF